MTEVKTFSYESRLWNLNGNGYLPATITSHNGIKTTFQLMPSRSKSDPRISLNFFWKFAWDELAIQRVTGFGGQIVVKYGVRDSNGVTIDRQHRFDVVIPDAFRNRVEQKIDVAVGLSGLQHVQYTYHLTPIRADTEIERLVEANFKSTSLTDAVLIVDGKKIPINKAILSAHSPTFHSKFLFGGRSETLPGQPLEVPLINPPKYDDFIRFLSVFHQQPHFPTDETAESLLALAKKYTCPFVTKHVERHLALNSKLEDVHLLFLSEKYEMESVEKKALASLKTSGRVMEVQSSPFYAKLSEGMKLKMFEYLCSL